ncbi:MAG: sulfite exporter TauE/SafE family protein [Xanthomonadales bacterium]|jgi:uncharacterized membrane protein YfcA|nr:sulfite exporter TauE/SafE family protein [Xanthomonadales bacterium]
MDGWALLLLGLAGLLSGVLAGLLGIGGGLVLVPVLAFLLPLQGIAATDALHVAVATSSATIFFTALSSARAHAGNANVDWPSVLRLAPGLVIGAGGGALVVATVPDRVLTVLVVGFCVHTAWTLLKPRASAGVDAPALRPWPVYGAAGLGIGAVAAAVGIAGGSLVVPFLLRCGMTLKRAIGSSAAAGVPVALASAVGYLLATPVSGMSDWAIGLVEISAILPLAVGSVLAAPWGAALARRAPVPLLKRVFAGWLLLVALLLLLR